MKGFNPFSLEEKTIIVTGASSGIGRQCAIDCSRMGAKVVLIARNEERLQETMELLEGDGHKYFSYDLWETEGIEQLVSGIIAACGKVSGFLHCAGVEMTKPIQLLTTNDYENILKVNTLSALEFVRRLSSPKRFAAGGSIVFISSITAVVARQGVAAYSASKGALVSAARVIASELSKRNIRVNCISPGTVLTPMMENFLKGLSEADYNKRLGAFPLGIGQTSDVSYACIYLLSDASRWITGQNLVIDGGYTMM